MNVVESCQSALSARHLGSGPMLRCLLALALVLLAAGCAGPEAVAGQENKPGGKTAVAEPLATTQVASRPARRGEGALALAGLTVPAAPTPPRARPAITKGPRPLQCVPYARTISGINLRGDAWTWWNKADGHYAKGHAPRPGAVLVLSKTQRLRRGHLAVVAEVRSSREIIVHQANWLNGGRIHRYIPVRDISRNNDWSAVRIWYTPGRAWGARSYAVYGFIYPQNMPELRQAAR